MTSDWESSYELGRKAFEEKRYSSAVEHLEKVVAEKPTFADVFNMLGLAYYHTGKLEGAMGSFKKALEINPSYTEVLLNLAVIYNDLGRYDEAREVYGAAKTSRRDPYSYLDPYVKGKLANMHADIGHIYRDLGFYSDAAKEYKRALRLRPEFVDIKTSLAMAHRGMRDYAAAVTELEDAVRINGAYAMSRIQLGLTYYLMGEKDKARTHWKQVLDRAPDDKMARMYMNLLESTEGRG